MIDTETKPLADVVRELRERAAAAKDLVAAARAQLDEAKRGAAELERELRGVEAALRGQERAAHGLGPDTEWAVETIRKRGEPIALKDLLIIARNEKADIKPESLGPRLSTMAAAGKTFVKVSRGVYGLLEWQ